VQFFDPFAMRKNYGNYAPGDLLPIISAVGDLMA
jgi:hypothetical protein